MQTFTHIHIFRKIPDNYKIIFIQGGGAAQFAAIPLNLCSTKESVGDYVVTGAWSKQAAQEGADYCKVNIVTSSESSKFTTIPPRDQWKLSPNAAFLHYCENETIHGVSFPSPPADINVPLVCDMSSSFLSRPVDVSKYGIIYAGAQKNAGIAGVTIVIIREDLLERSKADIPSVINYKKKCEADSLDNTPPVFNIYMTGLVLKWLKGQGGLEGIAKHNHKKAQAIYNVIDNSNGFYVCPTEKSVRSEMNIPIRIKGNDTALEEAFLHEAEHAGLVELKGHRSVGGLRVSLYNAMSEEGTETLARFMQEFRQKHL
jgi:phosphoserine aminotransferase